MHQPLLAQANLTIKADALDTSVIENLEQFESTVSKTYTNLEKM